jgi:hypothetical protein
MEFFDIEYCKALIESNKPEDISYKLEELKNINKKYINDSLKIEIKLNFKKLENISNYKKCNLIVVKNLIEINTLNKEIKSHNNTLNNTLNNTCLKKNKTLLNNINNKVINTILDIITNQKSNKYKLSILKLQNLFNFKINKKNKYIFNLYYNDLKDILNIIYENKIFIKDHIDNIRILLHKISQLSIKNELFVEINSFFKNKKEINTIQNKLNLSIKKKDKQITKLKSNIEKQIKIYKNKQNEFNNKAEKIYSQLLLVANVVKNNQNSIDRYKKYIKLHKNKKNITNNMNKNYNKCKKFNKNSDITCPICLDQIEEGIVTSCNHQFHLGCINLYVNNIIKQPIINIICPMCRAYI